MELDRYDRHILEILQQEGRIANQDLADRIGLSPSPCLRRVRALEESGLIRGYRALLDARKLGLSLMALVYISMDRHTPERFENFEAAIGLLPEVLECLLITGQDADYQPGGGARYGPLLCCCSTRHALRGHRAFQFGCAGCLWTALRPEPNDAMCLIARIKPQCHPLLLLQPRRVLPMPGVRRIGNPPEELKYWQVDSRRRHWPG